MSMTAIAEREALARLRHALAVCYLTHSAARSKLTSRRTSAL